MSRLPENVPFTMIPNFIFDEKLDELCYGEMKVLFVIYRNTLGYDKKTDEIAYSQFIATANLSKSTISDAVDSLISKNLITVDKSALTNRYGYVLPERNTGPSLEPTSSINEQDYVQKSNTLPVRKSNTQKKGLKENERNTTNSRIVLSDEINQVIDQWNRTYNNSFNQSDSQLVHAVKQRLEEFTVKELQRAIFIRKRAKFYAVEKPDLKNKPSSFFFYPETIRNDMNRTPKGIYTYEVLINKVTTQGFDMEHYQIIPELYDENGNELWGTESDILEFTGGIKESSEQKVVN